MFLLLGFIGGFLAILLNVYFVRKYVKFMYEQRGREAFAVRKYRLTNYFVQSSCGSAAVACLALGVALTWWPKYAWVIMVITFCTWMLLYFGKRKQIDAQLDLRLAYIQVMDFLAKH